MKRLRFTLFLFLECIISGGAVFFAKTSNIERETVGITYL